MHANTYDISNLTYRNEIILFGFDVLHLYIKVKKQTERISEKVVFVR